MGVSRKLISSDEAVPAKTQHKRPCSDCPWSRDALPGWLGGASPEEWVACAHGDDPVPCHALTGAQCAGIAIYRANVAKLPRNPETLRLPPDREAVFSSPVQFGLHHEGAPAPAPAPIGPAYLVCESCGEEQAICIGGQGDRWQYECDCGHIFISDIAPPDPE